MLKRCLENNSKHLRSFQGRDKLNQNKRTSGADRPLSCITTPLSELKSGTWTHTNDGVRLSLTSWHHYGSYTSCSVCLLHAVHCSILTQYLLSLEDQLAHADQVLSDFGESLFTLVSDEPRPVNQVLIDLFQSFLVVFTELHLHKNTQTPAV